MSTRRTLPSVGPDSAKASEPAWRKNIRSDQVRALDPKRHTLIEASAGTGKTFAIEHLVLRLLVENPGWNPEELLLLSFTEKTVAELRDRIRRLLRAQLDDSDPMKRIAGWSTADLVRIRQVWLHADDLSVHTLHAFCQSALRRDPLANNALIRTELTEDWGMAEIALDPLLRTVWPRQPGRLQQLTEALGIGAGEAWRKKLIRIALKWQPWRHDTLDPDCNPGTLGGLEAEAHAAVQSLAPAIAAVENGSFPIAEFRKSFAFTDTGRTRKDPDEALRKDPFEKVFRFTEKTSAGGAEPAEGGANTREVLAFFKKTYSKAAVVMTRGWESVLPSAASTLAEWKTLALVCGNIRRLSDAVAEARDLQKYGLISEAAQELRAAIDAEKLRRGLISYEDMPRNLVEALRRSPAIAARIGARYKACIVDEFQDTDPLQWEILEALCLQGEPNLADDADTDQITDHVTDHNTAPLRPLFLVGDPKQAIYAFRGGDLRTYMAARGRFRALAAAHRAQGVGLDANHRSRKVLIDALNAAFAHEAWFGPPPEISADPAWQLPAASDRIVFTPVHAGRREDESDRAAGAAIVLRDLSATETGPDGKPKWPRKADVERNVRDWIVARITEALQMNKGIRPGDFAVLTRSNNEGEAIARLLRRRGVPCRIRQKGGPFHGPAADALRLLLEWIEDAANPDAQARILMLPFARRDAFDIPKGRPDRCPPWIARAAALAEAGRWPEFFGAILHEGGYRARLAADSEAEAARFDRLVEKLSEEGAAPGTTARALCERFDALRRGEEGASADEGEDTDAAGGGTVTVMTLHLSKGLEFRHVFVAASGGGGKDDFLVLRDPDLKGFRIALDTRRSDMKARADLQSHDEDKRLFYVALTRAKETVQVPLLPEKFAKAESGPLGGFVAEALRSVARILPTEGRDAALAVYDTAELWSGSLTADLSPVRDSVQASLPDRAVLVDAARAAFARRRRLTSYSRLAHHAGSSGGGVSGNEETAESGAVADPILEEDGTRVQKQEPVTELIDGLNPAPITATELPPGAAAGTALHNLLEHTPFASVRDADTAEEWLALDGNRIRVEETLRRASVDPACAPAAARAVWNALRTPLPALSSEPGTAEAGDAPPFRLADLGAENLRHEVEFLMAFDTDASSSSDQDRSDRRSSPQILPEGVALKQTQHGVFLWGFIDLVFRHGGRYYLLDWKSNLLDDYGPDSVRASMEHHQYDLQWKLYAVALDRWLRQRVPDYDPQTHFGGVHYLYLRGAAPDRFAGFATRPTPEALRTEYPREIATLLNGLSRENG